MSNVEPPPLNQPPYQQEKSNLMNLPAGPPPPMGYGAPPVMPNQYQAYPGPPGAVPVQPQQTIFITNVQASKEPDYLGYSIFTLLCCFLPLGIAALIYSVKTQEANHRGDIVTARKYSRLALILDHTALGLGIAFIVLSIIVVIIVTTIGAAAAVSSVNQFQSQSFNP